MEDAIERRGAGIRADWRNNPVQSGLPMHLSPRCGTRTQNGMPCQSPPRWRTAAVGCTEESLQACRSGMTMPASMASGPPTPSRSGKNWWRFSVQCAAFRRGERVEPQPGRASCGSSGRIPDARSASAAKIQRPWPKPLNSTAAGKVRGSFRAIRVCWRANRATPPATGFLLGVHRNPESACDLSLIALQSMPNLGLDRWRTSWPASRFVTSTMA